MDILISAADTDLYELALAILGKVENPEKSYLKYFKYCRPENEVFFYQLIQPHSAKYVKLDVYLCTRQQSDIVEWKLSYGKIVGKGYDNLMNANGFEMGMTTLKKKEDKTGSYKRKEDIIAKLVSFQFVVFCCYSFFF